MTRHEWMQAIGAGASYLAVSRDAVNAVASELDRIPGLEARIAELEARVAELEFEIERSDPYDAIRDYEERNC